MAIRTVELVRCPQCNAILLTENVFEDDVLHIADFAHSGPPAETPVYRQKCPQTGIVHAHMKGLGNLVYTYI